MLSQLQYHNYLLELRDSEANEKVPDMPRSYSRHVNCLACLAGNTQCCLSHSRRLILLHLPAAELTGLTSPFKHQSSNPLLFLTYHWGSDWTCSAPWSNRQHIQTDFSWQGPQRLALKGETRQLNRWGEIHLSSLDSRGKEQGRRNTSTRCQRSSCIR